MGLAPLYLSQSYQKRTFTTRSSTAQSTATRPGTLAVVVRISEPEVGRVLDLGALVPYCTISTDSAPARVLSGIPKMS
jgi:hypothetical protein